MKRVLRRKRLHGGVYQDVIEQKELQTRESSIQYTHTSLTRAHTTQRGGGFNSERTSMFRREMCCTHLLQDLLPLPKPANYAYHVSLVFPTTVGADLGEVAFMQNSSPAVSLELLPERTTEALCDVLKILVHNQPHKKQPIRRAYQESPTTKL